MYTMNALLNVTSPVYSIWRERDKIEAHVFVSPMFAKKRCIMRDSHFEKLDDACYLVLFYAMIIQ